MKGKSLPVDRTYSVYEVFTPTTQARVNFIARAGIEKGLEQALKTPGKQIVIYGESGSGKSTLLVNALERLGIAQITTRCSNKSTFESVVLDAFDQLDPYFTDSITGTQETSLQASLETQFSIIKSQLATTFKESTSETRRRILPPQLTPQRLGMFLAASKLCWVLEDFHKVPESEKSSIAQTLKIFSDLGAEHPTLRIVALGATDTAREVVQFDREMKNRVAEIHVPLMNEKELRGILDNGSALLNVGFQAIAADIVAFSAGLASVTHHFALNACLNCGVHETRHIKILLDGGNMEAAISRYIEESSDTLKSLFDLALIRQRERRYDNTKLILKALASGPIEGLSHAEVRAEIQKEHRDYPAGNVTTYLRKLQEPGRGAVVRQSAEGKFRFSDPILHSYGRALFKVGTTSADPWSQQFDQLLVRQLTIRTTDRTASQGRYFISANWFDQSSGFGIVSNTEAPSRTVPATPSADGEAPEGKQPNDDG